MQDAEPNADSGPMQDLGVGSLLSSGVKTSSCSFNRATTFLMTMFQQNGLH